MCDAIVISKAEGCRLVQLTGGRIPKGSENSEGPGLACHAPRLRGLPKAHRVPLCQTLQGKPAHSSSSSAVPRAPGLTYLQGPLLLFILAPGSSVLWGWPWAAAQRQLSHKHCPWAPEQPDGVCRLSHLIPEGRTQTHLKGYIICPRAHNE